MAKKTTKPRRDTRPRLNQSQLQAYRARKAETVIVPRPAAEASATASEAAAPSIVTHWGRVDDEYAMIVNDLKRLLVITGLMLLLIIALWFVLG